MGCTQSGSMTAGMAHDLNIYVHIMHTFEPNWVLQLEYSQQLRVRFMEKLAMIYLNRHTQRENVPNNSPSARNEYKV